LLEYQLGRSGPTVRFDIEIRAMVLRGFILKMRTVTSRVIACSVSAEHLHVLAEMQANYAEVKRIIGRCKQRASHCVREKLPGTIWSDGAAFNRIIDRGHLRNTYNYIRIKQEPGTVLWSHRTDENWVDSSQIGVPVVGPNRKIIRVFAIAQNPAS
jgi:REP element-mobilizing transposase RayT